MTQGGIASPLRDPPRPKAPVFIKPPPTFQRSLSDSASQGCSPPHVLRHSFATKAFRRGVSPFVLMRLLGHSHIKTTLVYVHASGFDDLAAALDKMA